MAELSHAGVCVTCNIHRGRACQEVIVACRWCREDHRLHLLVGCGVMRTAPVANFHRGFLQVIIVRI